MSARLAHASDSGRAPIVALPPPSAPVRDAVVRLLIDRLARRALIDLGAIADNENVPAK